MNLIGRTSRVFALAAVGAMLSLAGGCGGGGGTPTSTASQSQVTSPAGTGATGTAPASSTPAAGGQVLPVPANPIANTSTAPGLTITQALVENNVSPDTNKAVDDHLEITLKNTSGATLDQIGVYYKVTDATKGVSESYYTKLDGVTVAPGASRVIHFDQASGKDHYPVNKFGLYSTDKNALTLDVMASSPSVKPAVFTVKKDSGGAENGVE